MRDGSRHDGDGSESDGSDGDGNDDDGVMATPESGNVRWRYHVVKVDEIHQRFPILQSRESQHLSSTPDKIFHDGPSLMLTLAVADA